MPTVDVVGVYPVEAAEPCHLVELIVRGTDGPFEVETITQFDPDRPASDWQVPFGEKVLDAAGEQIEHDFWDGPGDRSLWVGDMRIAFFFHFLDLGRPLTTPFGDVLLPAPTDRPVRLRWLEYEEP